MADSVTQFSTLSNDAPNVWIAQRQYVLAERNLVIGRYAEKFQLPQRMGTTLRVTRHKRLTLPTVPLTEGTPPDAVGLTIEKVDVTVEQWGIVALLTDVVQLTTTHPALTKAIELTGLAMSEVLEREQAKMLLAGTSVLYGGAATTRAGLAATDKLTTGTVLKATAGLRARGAQSQEGQLYAGVMSPQQEADVLSTDTTFQNASNFANVRALQYGEIGIWMGVRWGRSNFLPILKGVAAIAASNANTAEVSGHNMSSSGGALDGSLITVVARDANSGYERKISPALTVASSSNTVNITTPTSLNYVYDIYMTNTSGLLPKIVVTGSLGNVVNTLSATTYTNGTLLAVPVTPTSQISVFVAWVFGKDAFGRVELNGMSMQSYVTPAGASFSNPLAQGRKIGSKIMWKSFILDNNFFTRIETGSAFSDELPA
jgi:N4-gp56 family major capsid protein